MITNRDGSVSGTFTATASEVALIKAFGKEFDLDFAQALGVVRQKERKNARSAIAEAASRRSFRYGRDSVQLDRSELRKIAGMFGLVVDYENT